MMHKRFYASGFLFNLPSQQILLQQTTPISPTSSSPWQLFSAPYSENEEPNEAFKKLIFDLLGIKIENIQPIYSYIDDNTKVQQTIMYGELETLHDFPAKDGLTFAWFSFKDVLKLQAAKQIKHDIVVGQRVIDAIRRKAEGQHTSEHL